MYKACWNSTPTEREKSPSKNNNNNNNIKGTSENMFHFSREPEGNTKYKVTEQLALHAK